MGALQARLVGVVCEAEDRDVGPSVDHRVGVDPCDVGDHEVGCVDAVRGHEVVSRKETLELPPEEEVDPREQDRRHGPNLAPWTVVANTHGVGLAEGIELIRAGDYFAAHEALETDWRAAPAAERDFLQGLVHVAVAWYQAGRGNRVGCGRQLEKAMRRLGAYAPEHRGVDVARLLDSVAAARAVVESGSLELPLPRV